MKKLSTLMIAVLVSAMAWSVTPEKMSYQAVIRNSSEQLVVNKKVGMRISILQNSETATAVYTETQTLTTNANGLVTLEIGAGKSGNDFSAIDWSKGPFFIKTETDLNGGTNYTISGVSQLLSVPYALHAKTVEIDKVDDADADPTNEIQTLSLSGTNLTLSKNGGTVTLPSSGGGDNWGTQTAVTNATLEGNGSTASPLKIAQQGATSGQTLKWNGTAWVPGDDAKGAGLTLPYSESVSNSDYAFSIGNSYGSAISGSSLVETGVYGSGGSFGVYGVSKSIGVYGYSESSYGVKGESSSSSGTGVSGINSSDTGYTFGVEGEATSPDGVGVYGHNDANSGIACGVKGESYSSEGAGVSGINSSDTGYTFGVVGTTRSPDGVSIYGYNGAKTGYNVGVKGASSSSSGTGVLGYNYSPEGSNYGVSGVVTSAEGIGVYGKNVSPGGNSYGVKGVSYSEAGTGVYGYSSASKGLNYGVKGESESNEGVGVGGHSNSSDGVGVLGYNDARSGSAIGVKGVTKSEDGIGVYGLNVTNEYFGIGVRGEAKGQYGYGVYGIGKEAGVYGSGQSYGVRGQSDNNGYGVYGGSVFGVGVYGFSNGGYAGYFRGRLVTTEDVGIGTDDPGYKLDVAGAINLNKGFTGGAIFCNGREALWFNEEYFSWGYGGSWNYFGDKIYIGNIAVDPGTNMLVVNGSAAKPGGGTWSTWSDIRLKDIQGNYEKGLGEIIKLKPVKFNYKAGNACNLPSDQNYVGFIAQDVQKVFPEAVSEGKDGYLSLDVNSINVALVNAIKELKDENDKMNAEAQRLKAENENLKLKNEQVDARLNQLEKLIKTMSSK